MSLGQILRQKREELKLTLDEVANRSGFSKPYLSTIETGKVKNPPSDHLLKKLERILKFEKGLLLKIAHLESMPNDIRHEFESAEAENQKLRQILQKIVSKKTQPSQIKRLMTINKVNVEQDESDYSAGKLIPVINKVAAGYPADFGDLDYPVGVADDYVRCPDLHDPNAFAVRVVGDSMEPKFKEGDIVVFSPAANCQEWGRLLRTLSQDRTRQTFQKGLFPGQENRSALQPRNDKHSPLIIDGDRINGIYRAVSEIRKALAGCSLR